MNMSMCTVCENRYLHCDLMLKINTDACKSWRFREYKCCRTCKNKVKR